jgi:hypothetical protein
LATPASHKKPRIPVSCVIVRTSFRRRDRPARGQALKVRIPTRACRWRTIGLAGLLCLPGIVSAGDVVAAIEVRGNTRTHTEVILRELLFQPGDRLATAAVAESERNLRRLLFLGRVHIYSESAAPGSVTVVVDDLYARALSPLLAGDDEEVSYGAVAVDYNLFGRGQTARLTAFDDARSGRRFTAQYGDPRLRDTHLRLATEVGWAQEGHTLGVSLWQPFFALATPWAFGATASSHEARTRLYSGGTLAALYTDRTDAASAWLVRSYGDEVKFRPGIQVSVSDRTFGTRLDDGTPPDGETPDGDTPGDDGTPHDGEAPGDDGTPQTYTYEPEDRRRVLPSLVLTIWQPRYVTDRFIRYLGPDEDFQVGSSATVRVGVSSQTLGSDRGYAFASATVSPRFHFDRSWYLFTSLSARSRWHGGGYESLLTNCSARLYGRLPEWPFSPTLAVRLDYDTLSRPEDAGSQYLLGGNSGLRGYLPRRFDGSRRLRAGVELRPVFLRRTDWALGGALFADAGGAWDGNPSLHSSVGAGMRLGLPRVYDTPVLRADLARGLAGGVWQLSFGLGQYF